MTKLFNTKEEAGIDEAAMPYTILRVGFKDESSKDLYYNSRLMDLDSVLEDWKDAGRHHLNSAFSGDWRSAQIININREDPDPERIIDIFEPSPEATGGGEVSGG